MTAQAQTANSHLLGDYIRRIYQARYLWLHLLLVGICLVLGFYSAAPAWGMIVLALAEYVFYIAFGLYAWIGWIVLRRADQIPLLASVTFITACWAFALTLTILAIPNPLRPYWWLGAIWPIVGFPALFVFFKFLRLVSNTRARVQKALSGSRRI